MPTGALTAAAIGGLASAGGGFALSKLFGSKTAENPYQPIQQFKPLGINAGGLTSSFNGTNYSVLPTDDRLAAVNNIAQQLGLQGDELAALRADAANGFEQLRAKLAAGTASLRDQLTASTLGLTQRNEAETAGLMSRNNAETQAILDRVAPGVSELRRSRLAEIENARNNAIGNLRENMAQRRVLGSSFGQDALARAEREFGQAKEKTAAESTMAEIEATRQLQREAFGTDADLIARRFGIDSDLAAREFAGKAGLLSNETQGDAGLFLQKLEAQNNLVNQQYEARTNQFKLALDDLNLQADVATKLAAGASSQLWANARLESELMAKEAAGQGKFFGKFFGQIAEPIGKAISSSLSKFSGLGGGSSVGGGTGYAVNPWSSGGIFGGGATV